MQKVSTVWRTCTVVVYAVICLYSKQQLESTHNWIHKQPHLSGRSNLGAHTYASQYAEWSVSCLNHTNHPINLAHTGAQTESKRKWAEHLGVCACVYDHHRRMSLTVCWITLKSSTSTGLRRGEINACSKPFHDSAEIVHLSPLNDIMD